MICSALSKRFKGKDILSVTGVRHQESAARTKMPVPKHLLFTKGWPDVLPTRAEAELIAEVRMEVFNAIGIAPTFITAESIIERFITLISEKNTAQKLVS